MFLSSWLFLLWIPIHIYSRFIHVEILMSQWLFEHSNLSVLGSSLFVGEAQPKEFAVVLLNGWDCWASEANGISWIDEC